MNDIPHRPRAGVGRCALAAALAWALAPSAQAFQFQNEAGDVTGSLDTTVSLGGSWRMESRDPGLVGITNGGTSRSPNEDDGDLNYDREDLYSGRVKLTQDFELKSRQVGLFGRWTYFYDWAYADQAVSAASGYVPRSHDRMASEFELLDAFLRLSFEPGGRNLNLRLGQQVINWGESTFIPNGISVVNGVDVARLRGPGAELKEALLPTPALWGSYELAPSVAVEAFYLARFRHTRLDARGSYFATNDFITDGGDKAYIGFGRRVDQHFAPGFFTLGGAAWAPRSADRDAGNGGEYGVALRVFARELNDSEFGFYYMNYHSRTPIVSGVRGAASIAGAPGIGGCGAASTLINVNVIFGLNPLGQGTCFAGAQPLVAGNYFVEYPENIRLWGLSFSTPGPAGIALQGEYSYRPNQPVQLASTELLLAALGLPNNITGAGTAPAAVTPGTVIEGYRRVEMHQAQLSATKVFGPMLGADALSAVGELGFTYLNLPSNLLFNGPATHLPAPGSFTGASAGASQPEGAGYATTGSWGYRLLARLDYHNAIGQATLSPRLAFAHDVHGVSPTFNQGTRAATLGLGLGFKEKWQADLAYTAYWGGRDYAGTDPAVTPGQARGYSSGANPLKDRDFLSLSVSYSF